MAEVFKPTPGLHRFPDISKVLDGINKGISAVRGSARWIARDWHWAEAGGGILALVGMAQRDNISQAAIQAWQVLNPVKPVERVIDQPQEQLVRVEPVNTPLAEPTPQGPPEPERKGGTGPNPPDDDQTIKDNSDSQDANVKDIAPLPPEPTKVPVRALTKETKVISTQTVDIVDIDLKTAQELYQKAVKEGKNLIPIPVGLGETGIIEQYKLSNNGVTGLSIKHLKPGTYILRAPVDGIAEGFSKDDLKYNPKAFDSNINFWPKEKAQNGKFTSFSYGLPLNADIVPRFRDSNKSPKEEFLAGDILATFTIEETISPDQKKVGERYGAGTSITIGFGSGSGANKEILDFSNVFLQDENGRPVRLK